MHRSPIIAHTTAHGTTHTTTQTTNQNLPTKLAIVLPLPMQSPTTASSPFLLLWNAKRYRAYYVALTTEHAVHIVCNVVYHNSVARSRRREAAGLLKNILQSLVQVVGMWLPVFCISALLKCFNPYPLHLQLSTTPAQQKIDSIRAAAPQLTPLYTA